MLKGVARDFWLGYCTDVCRVWTVLAIVIILILLVFRYLFNSFVKSVNCGVWVRARRADSYFGNSLLNSLASNSVVCCTVPWVIFISCCASQEYADVAAFVYESSLYTGKTLNAVEHFCATFRPSACVPIALHSEELTLLYELDFAFKTSDYGLRAGADFVGFDFEALRRAKISEVEWARTLDPTREMAFAADLSWFVLDYIIELASKEEFILSTDDVAALKEVQFAGVFAPLDFFFWVKCSLAESGNIFINSLAWREFAIILADKALKVTGGEGVFLDGMSKVVFEQLLFDIASAEFGTRHNIATLPTELSRDVIRYDMSYKELLSGLYFERCVDGLYGPLVHWCHVILTQEDVPGSDLYTRENLLAFIGDVEESVIFEKLSGYLFVEGGLEFRADSYVGGRMYDLTHLGAGTVREDFYNIGTFLK